MRRSLTILALLLTLGSLCRAAELPAAPLGRVSDLAGVLAPSARAELEARLQGWEVAAPAEGAERKGAPQIAVVTLPALGDEPIEDVTMRLAERWKIGSRADDGVLIALAPRERKVRIEVGYGLEGRLPDALASRIIREIMAPRLRGGDLGAGLTAGAVAVHQAVLGQPVTGQDGGGRPLAQRRPQGRADGALAGGGGIVLLLVLLLIFGRRGGGGFLAGMFLGSLFGRRDGGGFGGGGGFGDGGGGGFSGGGGSFGGGGASGDY